MAYKPLTTLVQNTITRLRMVGGNATQMYAENAIALMLEETYEMVRMERWWDHLMQWHDVTALTSDGVPTTAIVGAREGWRDVERVLYRNNSQPLPILSRDINPFRLTGSDARFIEPLALDDDPNNNLLFRVWPRTTVLTPALPIRVRYRADPADIFTNPSVLIPFDATCLINGAAYKYAADDGTNPASVASLQSAFEARLQQLRRAHDNAVINLDPRQNVVPGLDRWVEDWP